MRTQQDKAERFLALHQATAPLLLPNPWDAGSARLASLGFEALATTSNGFAATLGRLDGSVTRDEALAALGVRRISVGGAFAFAALGAAAEAARELRDEGTYGYWKQARPGSEAARSAFAVFAV